MTSINSGWSMIAYIRRVMNALGVFGGLLSSRLKLAITFIALMLSVIGVNTYSDFISNKYVNSGEICKAIMELGFGMHSEITKNSNSTSKVKIVSPVYGTDYYHCTARNGSVSWEKIDGRMRNTEHDSKISYRREGRHVFVTATYPDGSHRTKLSYVLADD